MTKGKYDNVGCEGCPFNYGDEITEMSQNLGCLPEPREWVEVLHNENRIMSCHESPNKKCIGFLHYCKHNNIEINTNDIKPNTACFNESFIND